MTKFYKKGYPRPQFVEGIIFLPEWRMELQILIPKRRESNADGRMDLKTGKLSSRFRMKVRRAELGYRMNAMLSGIPEASHLNFTKGKESF